MAKIEPLNLYIRGLKIFKPDRYTRITLNGITVLIGDRGSGKSTVLEALKFLSNAARLISKGEDLNMYVNRESCCLSRECYKLLSSDEEVVIPELFNKMSQQSNSVVVALEDSMNGRIWGVGIRQLELYLSECPFEIHEFRKGDDYTNEVLNQLSVSSNVDVDPKAIPITHVVSALRMTYTAKGSGILRLENIIDNGIGVHGEYLRDIVKHSYYAAHLPKDRYLSEIWKYYVGLAEKFLQLSESTERVVTEARPCYTERLCVIEKNNLGGEATILFDLLSIGSRNLLTILLELAIDKYIIENREFIERFVEKGDLGHEATSVNKLIACLEEPEIALHPSTLTALIELLVDIVKEYQNRLYVVITTHSPRILLPIFNRVRQSGLKDMLKVYLLNREATSTEVNELTVEKEIPEIATSRALLYYSLRELNLLEKLMYA